MAISRVKQLQLYVNNCKTQYNSLNFKILKVEQKQVKFFQKIKAKFVFLIKISKIFKLFFIKMLTQN